MNTENLSNRRKKWVIFIIVDLLLIAAFLFYFGFFHNKPAALDASKINIGGVVLPKAESIADFHLTDQNGKTFIKDNLKGRWTLMFFGFTNCGYVCPTTLSALNKMYKQLESQLSQNDLPQVVLVSVDPERDSVQKMKDYVTAFNPHFVGARADLPETVAFEKQLHISAVKMHAEGEPDDQYMVNHTAEILVINPNANVQAYLSFPHTPEDLIKDYKLLLSMNYS